MQIKSNAASFGAKLGSYQLESVCPRCEIDVVQILFWTRAVRLIWAFSLCCPQGCFEQRMKTWQRWQEAQSTLQKKREVEAKLLWANKPDKLQQAKEEITEVQEPALC